MVVKVVRGHAQEGSQVFKWGEESGRLSVGSRGDWMVSGPGVMPIHFWLNFDGERLFAASGEGAASAAGRQLDQQWTALSEGAELRFGFALLRVDRNTTNRPRSAEKRARPEVLLVAIASGVLLTAVLVAALFFRSSGSAPATPESSALAASAAASSTRATPTSVDPPEPSRPPLSEPVVDMAAPSPASPEPVPLAGGPDAQSANFKTPPA